jgi:CRISPR/Cas system-associated exonuclease Cas4 (RecB family)
MLKLFIYDHSLEVIEGILRHQSELTPCKVVTPEPNLADILRNKFLKKGFELDAITVSKHINDGLSQFLDKEVSRKSQIYRDLLTLWEKASLPREFELFEEAYTLLTDIRGITFDETVIDEVLTHYPVDLQKAVKLFHVYLENSELVDEHRSYQLLSDYYRHDFDPHLNESYSYIFWGFEFLSGGQVDYLKTLSKFETVIIPIHKDVYQNAIDWDWVKWLETENTEIHNFVSEQKEKKTLKVHTYPRGYLSSALASMLPQDKNIDLYLASNQLHYETFQLVPAAKMFFKTNEDIFKEGFDLLWDDLSDWVRAEKRDKKGFQSQLKNKIQFYKERFDLKKLKILSLLYRVSDDIESNTIDLFQLNLFFSIAAQDLPRVNFFPIQKETTTHIYKLRDALGANSKSHMVLCLDETFGKLKSSSSKFLTQVEKLLAPIGPLRRNELELEVLKSYIKELMSFEEILILQQYGLEESDIGLSSLYEEVEVEFEALQLKTTNKSFPKLEEKTQSKEQFQLSASKLQKYIDCPKSYYYLYELKHREDVYLKEDLFSFEIGSIEHQLIKDIFEKDISNVKEYAADFLTSYAERNNKYLTETTRNKILFEVNSILENGLNFLRTIKETHGFQFKFEEGFTLKENFGTSIGFIDCYSDDTQMKLIVDFKRSNASIPSKVEVENIDSIQTWFYYHALYELNSLNSEDKVLLGYYNFRKPEDSLFFGDDQFRDSLARLGIKKLYPKTIFSEERYQRFKELLQETVNKINIEKNFPEKPRKKETCQYCDLNMVCARGTP